MSKKRAYATFMVFILGLGCIMPFFGASAATGYKNVQYENDTDLGVVRINVSYLGVSCDTISVDGVAWVVDADTKTVSSGVISGWRTVGSTSGGNIAFESTGTNLNPIYRDSILMYTLDFSYLVQVFCRNKCNTDLVALDRQTASYQLNLVYPYSSQYNIEYLQGMIIPSVSNGSNLYLQADSERVYKGYPILGIGEGNTSSFLIHQKVTIVVDPKGWNVTWNGSQSADQYDTLTMMINNTLNTYNSTDVSYSITAVNGFGFRAAPSGAPNPNLSVNLKSIIDELNRINSAPSNSTTLTNQSSSTQSSIDSQHQTESSYFQQNQSNLESTGISNFQFDGNVQSGLNSITSDFGSLWGALGQWKFVYTFTLLMGLATFLIRHRSALGGKRKSDKDG